MNRFSKFSLRQQQIFAGSFLLLTVILFVVLLILPMLNRFYENQELIENQQFKLTRYLQKIDSRDHVLRKKAETDAFLKTVRVFGSQSSIALVLADMQQAIKNAVTNAHGELNSTQNLAQKSQDTFVKVGINVRFVGRVQTLNDFLYEIESARPYMMIENLKIQAMNGINNSITGKLEPQDEVHVSADVISFFPQGEQ